MSQPRICPECNAEIPVDAPPGVCPYCALRAGLRWEAATEADQQWGPGTPLSPEELGRRLPELEAFELIGPGGMGTVYKARHRELDRPVAVKVLHPHLRDDAAFSERFIREARTLAHLDHPNIVRVYDFGHREGVYFLVMEFVDGTTLRQAIEAGGMTPKDALSIVPRICEALQYAHDQGVVHRDIKPENILLDRAGVAKIADFGLAKLTGAPGSTRLTKTAQVMGTPHYMAPEQIEHPTEVDHRADIYALGVVFYEMLTGELPVGRFPPPSQKVEVDVRLDQVVLRTLEKEPELRYQQASELGTAVESLSDTDQTHTRSGWAPTGRGWPLGRRMRLRYEYRSKRTVWGIPLVHVAYSGDPTGRHMALARGIIAFGDMAVGLVAVGAFAVGGVTFAGIGLGLFSFGGVSAGLLLGIGGVAFGLLAVGGVAIGGFALGGAAIGLVAAAGRAPETILEVPAETILLLTRGAWALATAVVTVAVVAVIAGLRHDSPKAVN
jgi:predicted Ser/Thr protein kinase